MKTPVHLICLLLLTCILTRCNKIPGNYYDSGVSITLAESRKYSISDISYNLKFSIPADLDSPVQGYAVIDFSSSDRSLDLLLDFRVSRDNIEELALNGVEPSWKFENDHIIIPGKEIDKGQNRIYIKFEAGELSLNRNDDFMYTLFVPDRASTAFPCFDQPDLKAKFRLTLEIDSSWHAIANNPLTGESISEGRKTVEFDEGKPISTYLFAFAAGMFSVEERSVDGINMQMLHRESRKDLVTSNIDEIFNLHAHSIRWLEDYTSIEYPFDKFGFALIPSFQYGGMEHPGSIYYRASSLLLEDNPSLNQKLSRASLIAHETSHIWFGDLVTMDWFNDVWLKEVFAGYMADKITNPSFPEVNHDLRFILGRYPAAYSVDRTAGTNPVIQDLDNMKNAGTLYGAIIYNKAPVIMKHLELMLGEEQLRDGLRQYLAEFSFGNAKWDDLVSILDPLSDSDVRSWSEVWVKEAGRPVINTSIEEIDGMNGFVVSETDKSGEGRHWPQKLETLLLFDGDSNTLVRDFPASGEARHPVDHEIIGYIPDIDGITYGFIKMPLTNIRYLLENIEGFDLPLTRGVIRLNIYENMIEGIITPDELLGYLVKQINSETDPLLMSQLRGMITGIYWNQLEDNRRIELAEPIENAIIEKLSSGISTSEQRSWFNTYTSVSMSDESLNLVYDIWSNQKSYGGIKFSEPDYTGMAYNLALKSYPGSAEILQEQASRISNPDRKAEFLFVTRALDSSWSARDEFFLSLKDPANREHEPWVARALGYLHHPLNSDRSVKFIPESLDLLEEIQNTGDIFFPGQWISSTLEGHNSEEAFIMVNDFLEENPEYPPNLKLKILQAADHLYRKYGEDQR